MKRDLMTDLKSIQEGRTLFDGPDPSVRTEYELYEVAEHAIERALKAESLARELVGLLQMTHRAVVTLLGGEDVPPEAVDHLAFGVAGKIRRAKEVLGDEKRDQV
jgi:hypothetical protein